MRNNIFKIILLSIMALFIICFVILFLTDLKEIQKQKDVATVSATRSNAYTDTTGKTVTDLKLPDSGDLKDESERTLKIVAVGDVLLGRTVKLRVITKKERYLYPFLKVVDILKQGDVVFGNLEESITSSNKCLLGINEGGKYVLKNDVEAINGIKYAGFNLLSLANNHILDYYATGLVDTQRILKANNIAYAGAGQNLDEARKLAVIERNGLKIGLLAYTDMANVVYAGNPPLSFLAGSRNPGVAPTKESYIKEDIEKARASVDFLVVSFHWGMEDSFDATQKQIKFAHELIDSGVDMILGHHPHRTQAVEIYKGKPIFYSLGNFIFDQNKPENMQGFIMNMEFSKKKLSSLTAIPYKIIDKYQIIPQTGKDAISMINREIKLCEKVNTKGKISDDKMVISLDKDK